MSVIRYRRDAEGNWQRAPRGLWETKDVDRARYLNERTAFLLGLSDKPARHPLDPPEQRRPSQKRGTGANHDYKLA